MNVFALTAFLLVNICAVHVLAGPYLGEFSQPFALHLTESGALFELYLAVSVEPGCSLRPRDVLCKRWLSRSIGSVMK